MVGLGVFSNNTMTELLIAFSAALVCMQIGRLCVSSFRAVPNSRRFEIIFPRASRLRPVIMDPDATLREAINKNSGVIKCSERTKIELKIVLVDNSLRVGC